MKSFHIVPGLIFLGLTLAAGAATAQQYTISTFAGVGTVQGYSGDTGPATSAQFWSPGALALDSKGDLYIADTFQYVVREVTTDGLINSVAGSDTPGYAGDDGPGYPQASLSYVQGLAVDPGGNLYIGDTTNHVVRILNPTLNIYTFAGINVTPGNAGDGGKATKASLISPAGLATDSAGNVYIADYGTSTVRKVDIKGMISTIAGNGTYGYTGDGGPASKAQLAAPYSLAIDPAGNIFIADLGNSNIREITTDGNIRTVVSGVMAESIAVDAADSIYFPDYLNNTVQKVLSNGTRFAIAGNGTQGFSGDGGLATSAQLYFNLAFGIAVDASGNVYVSDSGNEVVRVLKPVASSVSVANAASGVGSSVSPGEIVSIFAPALGPSTPSVAQPDPVTGYYGTQLAGTTVSFNGFNAPILYTSASQINAIVPYEIALDAASANPISVAVNYRDQPSLSSTVPGIAAAPSLFTANATGLGQAAAINQDGSLNSPSSPARQGTIVSLYMTGEGQTTPGGIDGKPAPVTNPPTAPTPNLGITAYLSGQPVQVTYQGGAPGLVAGLMQLNLRIPGTLLPAGITAPVAVPVQLVVGSGTFYFFVTPGVTISVAP